MEQPVHFCKRDSREHAQKVAEVKRDWFSVPFRGIVLATALYVAALVASRLSS
jgi:hypothetical protein